MVAEKKKISKFKIILLGLLILFIVGAAGVWYILTQKFEDTATQAAIYEIEGLNFIKEFEKNDSLANAKYTEKIITIKGAVSEIELADTIINIKMIDTVASGYIIFSFQEKNMAELKNVQEGDLVKVKGSCSGGAYSEILEANYISFKRCVLIK